MFVPRRNAVDVEVGERDVDARVVDAVEEIVALDVARVQTRIVGRCERTVPRRLVVERERAVLHEYTIQRPHAPTRSEIDGV